MTFDTLRRADDDEDNCLVAVLVLLSGASCSEDVDSTIENDEDDVGSSSKLLEGEVEDRIS